MDLMPKEKITFAEYRIRLNEAFKYLDNAKTQIASKNQTYTRLEKHVKNVTTGDAMEI